ncbi:MAG: S41 family peptidase [Pyrinomonadaceae bacterium]
MKSIYLLILLLASAAAGLAQSPASPVAAAQIAPETAAGAADRVRLETFEKVWTTINERHYDPTFGGVDWSKVREIYLPKARAAKTDDELHAILRRMLGELHLSHFGIFPKEIATRAAGSAGIGVELKMIGGDAVVWRVDPSSTAAAAGLKPGAVVRGVDGKQVSEILKPLEDSFAGRQLSERLKRVYRERTIEAAISGAPETPVSLVIVDERDMERKVEAVRKRFEGELSQPLGNFPAQQVIFESRRLEGNIGYIRFNMWVMPQIQKIRTAVREFADARGIIFDLRGNPGGIGGIASAVAGMLSEKDFSLGSMTSRSGTIRFAVFPQKEPFLGKVAILTDHGTGSTSEVFAAGMQEAGRAVIVGETSAGAVLPSVFEKLPTGAIFQYVVSDYRSPKNILIEGRGVKPDIEVAADRAALLAGRDAQLEAAVSYITK